MRKTQRKHEAHRLIYAIASDGRLVNVDEVETGHDCKCICPACKEPLVAKNNGLVREHHFAHLSGSECDFAYESMLHLLAKERVQNAFLNADRFYLDFEYRSYCPNEKKCELVTYDSCYTNHRKRFNLKDYYDSCEQEVAYDGIKRRSDLKLFSSTAPQTPPVYIEFCVTHPSEQEKLHSGNRIIECVIEDESDIEKIITEGFIGNNHRDDAHGIMPESKIQIYGFKDSDYKNVSMNKKIEFSRYVLFKSGKSRYFQDSCNCKEISRSSPSSLYEICFYTPVAFEIYDYAKYLGYEKFHIKNCILCKNYVDSFTPPEKICRSHKYVQTSSYDKFDTSRAKDCRGYNFNQEEYERMIQEGVNVPFDEI